MRSALGSQRRGPARPVPASSLRSDVAVGLISSGYGVIVALLVTFVGARTLSFEDFGRLSWVMTTAYLLGALGACGTPLSAIAHRGASADAAVADSFDRASLRLALVAGTVLCGALVAVAQAAPQVVGRSLASVAVFAGVLAIATAVVITMSAVLRGRRRFVLSVILSEQLLRTGVLVGIVVGWLAGRATASFVGAMAVGWALCCLLAMGAWVHSTWPSRAPATTLREAAMTSAPFFVGSIGTVLIPQAGVWTLGARSGPEEVAVLSVAIRLSMMCSLVAVTVNRSLNPRIASLSRNATISPSRLQNPSRVPDSSAMPGSSLPDSSKLGDGLRLGDASTLGGAAMSLDAATVRDRSTLGDAATVRDRSTLGDAAMLGDRSMLGDAASLRDASTVTFLLTAALALPIIIGGPWLTASVFGEPFRAAWAPAAVLLGGLLASTAAGPCGLVLYNSGHQRLAASRVLVAGVAFVGASAATAAHVKAFGVAAIAAATVVLLNLWQARTARRLTSIVTWTHVRPASIRASFRSMARSAASPKAHA